MRVVNGFNEVITKLSRKRNEDINKCDKSEDAPSSLLESNIIGDIKQIFKMRGVRY